MTTTHSHYRHAHYRNERGGLSTMAYVLRLAFATFCIIIASLSPCSPTGPSSPCPSSQQQRPPDGPAGQHG